MSVQCVGRDAIVINFVSFGTSLYAGIAVFSIIGFMAHEQHVPIEKVINSGTYFVKVIIVNTVSWLSSTKINICTLLFFRVCVCFLTFVCAALVA